MPPGLLQIGQVSLGLAAMYLAYLILKVVVPKARNGNGEQALTTTVAVLNSRVGTMESTVQPLTQLAGDVKVLLDAIEDLRDRVGSLEQERRSERRGGR